MRVLRNFLGTTSLLLGTSSELLLKVEFSKKWRTDILVIIKRYREVNSSFKKVIARESVYLITILKKLTLNLIVIFNSITDISFLKYVTKVFRISYYFKEKFLSVLRCSTQWLCLCIFYQVQVIFSTLYKDSKSTLYKDFGKNPRKLLAWNPFLLKLRFSKVFPAIFFRKFAEVLGQYLKSVF